MHAHIGHYCSLAILVTIAQEHFTLYLYPCTPFNFIPKTNFATRFKDIDKNRTQQLLCFGGTSRAVLMCHGQNTFFFPPLIKIHNINDHF